MVTLSWTYVLPWLLHPAHVCCHGYPILDIRVTLVTPSWTYMLPWLPHPAHTCCLGYPILLTPVAMVTPSWTHVLPWLPRCCCSRLLLWLRIHYTPVAMVTVVVHAFMSVSLWFPHTPVAMATRIPHACCHGDPHPAHACCHGDPHPTRLLPWRPILGCQRPHPSPSCSPPVSPWFPHPAHACCRGPPARTHAPTRMSPRVFRLRTAAHACRRGSHTRLLPWLPPPPIATVTAATPAAWLVAMVTGRHGYRSPRLPVAMVTGRHGYL